MMRRPGVARKLTLCAAVGVMAAVAAAFCIELLHDPASPQSLRVSSGPVTHGPLPQASPDSPGERELQEDEVPEAPKAPEPPAHAAGEPLLQDANTDLSFARRGGLHQAPNPLQLTASVALAVDTGTGQVLYERNADAILPVASLTKLLTGLVLLESGVSLRARLRIAIDDVDRLRHSRSRLRVGTRLSRAEALRLALMSSENRAAHALARTYPGGRNAFVSAMNAKAQALGMAHSTFTDPTGLSNRNRATARDIAKLAVAALQHARLRQYSITRTWRTSFGAGWLRYLNSNRLVRAKGWPIRLQKTGYIVEAGQCVTMVVRVKGREVALVLLDAGSNVSRGEDARKLRRWVEQRLAAR
jgi:D-alanyl-D-alanine endopeptidase (penicillin-binding protein 7)